MVTNSDLQLWQDTVKGINEAGKTDLTQEEWSALTVLNGSLSSGNFRSDESRRSLMLLRDNVNMHGNNLVLNMHLQNFINLCGKYLNAGTDTVSMPANQHPVQIRNLKMEQNRIDMFMASMSEKFPSEKLMLIRDQLARLDDSKFPVLQSVEYKNPTTLLIISLFLGYLGVDRFMLGQTGLGIAKLLTCGGFGFWAIIDWFLIMGATRDINYQKFNQFAI